MKRALTVLIALTASVLGAQTPPPAPLSNDEAGQLAKRVVELMESTSASLAELQLASAPLVAGARNTLTALSAQPGNATLTAQLTRQTRAFLAIADATPKPASFSETARHQFSELRDSFERLESYLDALIAEKEFLNHNPDPDDLKHYTDANTRVLPPNANPRVVFLGSSITEFWRLNEYFTGRDFLNRGISGQVTSQMLGRFRADVIDLHPKAVLILAGGNDIARGTPLSAIENNLAMMAELAQIHQIKVLLASVLPAGPKQTTRPVHVIQQLNNWIQQYCAQTGCTYVDYYIKLRDPSGALQSDLSDDGLHPNSKGYRLMSPVAVAAIDRALGKSSAPIQTVPKRRFHLM